MFELEADATLTTITTFRALYCCWRLMAIKQSTTSKLLPQIEKTIVVAAV